MTQAEQVRQAQAGDVDAFCALYTAYQQKLFHYAYYKLGNVQDAEDVVQAGTAYRWTDFKARPS